MGWYHMEYRAFWYLEQQFSSILAEEDLSPSYLLYGGQYLVYSFHGADVKQLNLNESTRQIWDTTGSRR